MSREAKSGNICETGFGGSSAGAFLFQNEDYAPDMLTLSQIKCIIFKDNSRKKSQNRNGHKTAVKHTRNRDDNLLRHLLAALDHTLAARKVG